LKTQKTTNNQGNTQQKEQCWRYCNTQLQTILQTNINKNSMVLEQKQTWRPVEQNRGPRYKLKKKKEKVFLCGPSYNFVFSMGHQFYVALALHSCFLLVYDIFIVNDW
jgi:hypothetical protein